MEHHLSAGNGRSGVRFDEWLRAVGVAVVAFAGGVVAYALIALSPWASLAAVGVTGVIGGLLMRGWWALLVVPAAVWLGIIAGTLAYGWLHGYLSDSM